MKVLYVSSGNTKQGISPIIKNQGESLMNIGFDISYYTIEGKGIKGYFYNIFKLRKFLKNNKFDIIHAHYSLSAIVASLSGAKPLIVSLMGSDVKGNKLFKFIIWVFYKFSWKKTIVKSEDMEKSLGFKNIEIVPNGVNLRRFKPINTEKCKKEIGWNNTDINILFAANPERLEKNYKLSFDAFNKIKNDYNNLKLHFIKDIPNDRMPIYHNAADIIILSSLWEGSPNVIKEAMACNKIILSTNVGDVDYLLKDVDGGFVSDIDLNSFKNNLKDSIDYFLINRISNGRDKIIEKELSDNLIADKLIKLYKTVLNEN